MREEVPIQLLAVDDDPHCLNLIQEALSQDGLEILTTTSPEAGLEMIRHRHPQIVLLDLMMPGVDGLELLEQTVESDAATDVILMTAHHSIESAVEAIRKGAARLPYQAARSGSAATEGARAGGYRRGAPAGPPLGQADSGNLPV